MVPKRNRKKPSKIEAKYDDAIDEQKITNGLLNDIQSGIERNGDLLQKQNLLLEQQINLLQQLVQK